MKLAVTMMILLILAGCLSKDKVMPQGEDSRFIVTDKDIIDALESKMQENHIVILEEQISLGLGEGGMMYYAVRNPSNMTNICIYSQFRCKTVLRGEGCDSQMSERNTGYFWKWFRPIGKTLVPKTETIYLHADITEDNVENVFLGEVVIWSLETQENRCPDIDQFAEREGIKIYGKAGFMLNIE